MDNSRLVSLITKPFLFLLEYLFKFTAGVIGIIVLGGEGSFFGKLGVGFASLLDVFYKIAAWPEKFVEIGNVIRDYNTLTASAFNQKYGGQAVNQVMESLNGAVAYFQAVYQNIITQPFATVFATLIAFGIFYFTARVFRFVRQRGKGSYLVKKERELGNRVFRDSEK